MDWEAVQDTTAESMHVTVKVMPVGGLGSRAQQKIKDIILCAHEDISYDMYTLLWLPHNTST